MNPFTNKFVKSVLILFTGTVLAQLISLLFAPIISRIYGPEENAYLGLFLKITSLAATVSTLRLELALPTIQNNEHAFGLYRFCLRLVLYISFSFLILFAAASIFIPQVNQELLFFLSLPLGLLLISFFNIGNNWAIRSGSFSSISRANIVLSSSSNVLKLGFAYFGTHYLFLIASTLLAYLIANVEFLNEFLKRKKSALLNSRSKRTKAIVLQQADLYKYNLPHFIIDLIRDILFAAGLWLLFDQKSSGSFDHAFRMLKLPILILAMPISQVFYKTCSDYLASGKSIFKLSSRTVLTVIGLGIIPFGILFFFGTEIFTFVFGSKWVLSGEMVPYLVPWLFMNLVINPISYIPILLKKQQTFFWLNVSMTACLIACFLIKFLLPAALNLEELLILVSGTQTAFLIVMLVWMLSIAKKANKLPG